MKKLLSTAIAGALLVWATTTFATTCQDLLDNNSYDCDFTNQFLVPFSGCLRFTSPGVAAEFNLTLTISPSTYTAGCSCGAKGSVTNPDFDAAKTFTCVDGTQDVAFAGKAGNGKIRKGNVTTSLGGSTVYSCTQRTTPCP